MANNVSIEKWEEWKAANEREESCACSCSPEREQVRLESKRNGVI